MGSKNNRRKKKNTNINSQKPKIDESNEINKIKSLILFHNEELLKFPSPIFKHFKNFNSNNDDYDFNSKYYIYKLKDINDAFYISFLIYGKGIVICKYYYEKEMFEIINTIKINISILEEIMIRNIYNDLDKKEYLFVEKGDDNLFIYLIKNEKNYELINKDDCKDIDLDLDLDLFGRRDSFTIIRNIKDINLFEVIYNQFDKNIYIITVYDIGYEQEIFKHYNSKEFSIKIFKENKLISYNLNYSDYDEYYREVKDLIYKDKNSNKYYILSFIRNNFRMIEIKEYISNKTIDIDIISGFKYIVNSEKEIKTIEDFFDKDFFYFNAKIFYQHNDTYLYISRAKEDISEIIVINLFKRAIYKQFKLKIVIQSFEFWGLKYLIILSNNSIYIFDLYTCQIITKYSNILIEDYITRIKTYFSKKNNFYGLFISSQYNFKLMYK